MKKYLILAGLWATAFNMATATENTNVAPPAIKNIIDLKKIVTEHNIKSIDALMPLLPDSMLKNPLLVYESHALNTYLVTPQTPRIILWSPDASFIMSVSRSPGQYSIEKGEDVIEFIQVNQKSKKFEMGKVPFDGVNDPFQKKIEMNPKACLRCHGSNPRPIFDSYNAWPGFYGSFGTRGYAAKGSKEYNNLGAFLQAHKDKTLEPRYLALDLAGFTEDARGIMTTSRTNNEMANQYKMAITLMYGVNLEARMWDRLGAKLVRDSRFQKLSPLFYYLGEETNRCGNPRDRIQKVTQEWINSAGHKKAAAELIKKINLQIDKDQNQVESFIARQNGIDNKVVKAIDELGPVAIPYSNLHNIHRTNQPLTFKEKQPDGSEIERPYLDNENFQNSLLILESVFRRLNYGAEDITTRPDRPTNGIFHLKRLGLLFKDEQFFQNMIGGIVTSAPDFKTKFDSMSCDDLLSLSKNIIQTVPVAKASQRGILYSEVSLQ